MTSEENPAVALFKSSHDEMREVIKEKSNDQVTSNSSSPMVNGSASEEEDPAVTKFREYIRIETVQPNPDNIGAMKFLARYAELTWWLFYPARPSRFSVTRKTWVSPTSPTSVSQASPS